LTEKELSLKNKVFGIGLSRTGTTSLTEALKLLGYKALHFPDHKVTQSEVYAFFASQSGCINLSILMDHDAITDTPVCCLYKALDKSYPGSKFILTIREKESWLHSCERYWKEVLMPLIQTGPDHPYKYIRFINEKVYGAQDYDREIFSGVYDTYNTEVVQYFRDRPQDFLILHICGGEGWSKLAPFLGATIPKASFPFENRLQNTRDNGKSDTGDANERHREEA
jgi:hypothetical protein